MDLKIYLAILWGNKWVIIATTAVTMAVVIASLFIITPIYSASTTIRVAAAASGSVSYTDYMYTDRLMNTYTKLATSNPVLNELAIKLQLPSKPQVKVEVIPSTELIRISVEDPNPSVAQSAANTLAEILSEQSKELYSGGGKSQQQILGEQLEQIEAELNVARQEFEDLTTHSPNNTDLLAAKNEAIQLKEKTYATVLDLYEQARLKEAIRENLVSVVEPATLPISPVKPRKALSILLGLLVGMAGGVGLVFLFENLDTRLYTSHQIEETVDLPIIGKIPLLKRNNWLTLNKKSIKSRNMVIREAFRRMRIKILAHNHTLLGRDTLATLLITSSLPNEGKSVIATHLAITMAQARQKVIVVDCDLHLPTQHTINGISNKIGLSNVLSKQVELDDAIQKSRYFDLQILTSGPTPPNPSELLGSIQMRFVLDQLHQRYDLIILDSPALLAVTDASLLAPMADGVALIARRGIIRGEAVREAIKQLSDVQAQIIGVVINNAEENGHYGYYHG